MMFPHVLPPHIAAASDSAADDIGHEIALIVFGVIASLGVCATCIHNTIGTAILIRKCLEEKDQKVKTFPAHQNGINMPDTFQLDGQGQLSSNDLLFIGWWLYLKFMAM